MAEKGGCGVAHSEAKSFGKMRSVILIHQKPSCVFVL